MLLKSPTGIAGLDELTGGGLPTGRPTLVRGGAGCGKTMLAAEFLVRGAVEFGEPGVFMMFEESAADLTCNVRSIVRMERSDIEETGKCGLETRGLDLVDVYLGAGQGLTGSAPVAWEAREHAE